MKIVNNIYKMVAVLLIFSITISYTKAIVVVASSPNDNELTETNDIETLKNGYAEIKLFEGIAAYTNYYPIYESEYVEESYTEETIDEDNIAYIDIPEDEELYVEEISYNEESDIEESNNAYSYDELYELAKIVMCEAEGEPQKCKEYIAQVILNRLESDKFPDTIHDIIFQKSNGVAQFSPTSNGRWNKIEPNQDCYDAVYTVTSSSEPVTNALYFEACSGTSWHSRNLTLVAEIGSTRFYV